MDAQKGSRGTALLFFLTSALDGVGGRRQAPAALPPGKWRVTIVQETVWATGPVWTVGEISPQRGGSHDRPACSESLYRLRYPGPFVTQRELERA
jgi:hypothetical protein